MSNLILAAIVAVAVFVGYLTVDQAARRKRQSKELAERIANDPSYDMGSGDDALLSMEKEKSARAEMLEGMLPMLGIDKATAIPKVAKNLAHAGMDYVNGPAYYLVAQRVLPIAALLLALPFLGSDKEGMMKVAEMMGGVMILTLGIFGPHLYVQNAIAKRKQILERSFPDALDLLLVCVESGLAIDAAFGRVSDELGRAHPVITEEFNRTRLELALLNDRSKALMAMGERTGLVPFKSLAAALIQTEKFGTSLTDTLRVLADDFRQTRLLMAENKANRLPALITIPLITMLLPAFMMIILGPAFIRVSQQGGIFGGG